MMSAGVQCGWGKAGPRAGWKRGLERRALLWLALVIVGAGLSTAGHAQGCRITPVPLDDFRFPTQARGVGDDGSRLALMGVPPDAADGDGAELYTFDPFTGALIQQTFGTAAGLAVESGLTERYTFSVVSTTADNTRVILSPSARLVVRADPTTGAQFLAFAGVPGVAKEINLETGVATDIPLPLAAVGPGQTAITQITGASRDHSRLSFVSYVVELGESGRIDAFLFEQFGIFDAVTGEVFDPLAVISQAIGRNAVQSEVTFFADRPSQLSGDGRSFVFISNRNLLHPDDISWSETPGNVYGIFQAIYWFNFDTQELRILVEPDISQPRVPVQQFRDFVAPIATIPFMRNIGFTGRVMGFDRALPLVGLPNPTGQPAVMVVSLDAPPRFVRLPQADPRGPFSIRGSNISENDERLYFQSNVDLVPGLNPTSSNQLFSFELATGTIRQITDLNDGIFALLQDQPDVLVGTGASPQTNFVGGSADHRVILVGKGGFTLSSTPVAGGGLRIGFGGGRASDFLTVYVCEEQ